MKITVKEIRFKLIEDKPRRAWGRGVKEYALDLLSGLEDTDYIQGVEFHTKYKVYPSLKETLLNGAISWDTYRDWETDRKSTRLNSSHITRSRMPSSA